MLTLGSWGDFYGEWGGSSLCCLDWPQTPGLSLWNSCAYKMLWVVLTKKALLLFKGSVDSHNTVTDIIQVMSNEQEMMLPDRRGQLVSPGSVDTEGFTDVWQKEDRELEELEPEQETVTQLLSLLTNPMLSTLCSRTKHSLSPLRPFSANKCWDSALTVSVISGEWRGLRFDCSTSVYFLVWVRF